MGALGVVLETVSSGISSLPFSAFLLMMQPIHLAIGIVEGLVTAAVVLFVYKARPEIMHDDNESRSIGTYPVRNVVLVFLTVALITGGFISWFASEKPDGLEWSITKVTGQEELKGPEQRLYAMLAAVQDKLAFLPDYSFKKPIEAQKEESKPESVPAQQTAQPEQKAGEKRAEDPKNSLGTSVAGLVGGMATLGLAFLIGIVLKRRNQRA
jgi:cobalt/nickel transport system permease protein